MTANSTNAIDAQNATSSRTIDASELAPGESTTVSVTVEASGDAAFTIAESFAPEFKSVELLDTDDADIAAVQNGDGEIVASYSARSDATLKYSVTAADVDSHTLDGVVDVVDSGQTAISGDTSISVDGDTETGPPPVQGDTPPQDLNGDGLYRDVNGDGEVNIFDVQTLFTNLDSNAVQNNPEAFNFNGETDPVKVDIFDVQALFEYVKSS